jgi:hypothetical protein
MKKSFGMNNIFFFVYVRPKLLACSSLRNSGYKLKKSVSPRDYTVKKIDLVPNIYVNI